MDFNKMAMITSYNESFKTTATSHKPQTTLHANQQLQKTKNLAILNGLSSPRIQANEVNAK